MWNDPCDLDVALYETAANTLEALGFMFTGLLVWEEQLTAPAHLSVGVRFEGPVQGVVYVTLCGGVLKQLTSNMLGEEAPPTDEDQEDALRELANVICGNLLPQIGGTEAVFDVKAPFVVKDNAFADLNAKPLAQAQVGLETGRAEIALYLAET